MPQAPAPFADPTQLPTKLYLCCLCSLVTDGLAAVPSSLLICPLLCYCFLLTHLLLFLGCYLCKTDTLEPLFQPALANAIKLAHSLCKQHCFCTAA